MKKIQNKIITRSLVILLLLLSFSFISNSVLDYKYTKEVIREGTYANAVLSQVKQDLSFSRKYFEIEFTVLNDGESNLVLSPISDGRGVLSYNYWNKRIGKTFPIIYYDKHYLKDYDGKNNMVINTPYHLWNGFFGSVVLAMAFLIYPYKVLIFDRKKKKN